MSASCCTNTRPQEVQKELQQHTGKDKGKNKLPHGKTGGSLVMEAKDQLRRVEAVEAEIRSLFKAGFFGKNGDEFPVFRPVGAPVIPIWHEP